jgi:hypothetical protein
MRYKCCSCCIAIKRRICLTPNALLAMLPQKFVRQNDNGLGPCWVGFGRASMSISGLILFRIQQSYFWD